MDNNTFNSKKSSLASVEIIESNKGQIALNNLEKRKTEKKIILKLIPELYKIRIGKKKTGLPNLDYPPINSANKIKSSNFTTLSIEYDEIHLETKIGQKGVDALKPKGVLDKNSNESYITVPSKSNNLNEKLIASATNKGDNDYNFSSELNDLEGVKGSNGKKCCDICSIF